MSMLPKWMEEKIVEGTPTLPSWIDWRAVLRGLRGSTVEVSLEYRGIKMEVSGTLVDEWIPGRWMVASEDGRSTSFYNEDVKHVSNGVARIGAVPRITLG